jgi:hypothetical protein
VIATKSKFYNIFLLNLIIAIFKWYNIKMATYRGQGASTYDIGEAPPFVNWTIVKGDTASFRVYLTDDSKQPLTISDWDIEVEFKRPTNPVTPQVITDAATLVFSITPEQDLEDEDGEFKVNLTAAQTAQLRTNDIFDIELRLPQNTLVWTVAQGKITLLEDVTN